MTDTTKIETSEITRRGFTALSLVGAAGLATSSARAAQGMQVVETTVQVKTPDGMCDASFAHPATGSHPGVIIWTDAFGLRPSMREFGKRLAADGYAVLVPNPFYRVAKAPVFDAATLASFSFGNPEHLAKLGPLTGSISTPGSVERDSTAFVAWLDAQPQVNKAKKMGTQGYCMGGPMTMRTAAAVPDRIGAGASFHGDLVSDKPTSAHLLVPKIKAKFYIGIGNNDDTKQPEAKTILKTAFDAAKNPAEIEVYAAPHGWCVPDIPPQFGMPIYNMAEAERAWSKLLAHYKKSIA